MLLSPMSALPLPWSLFRRPIMDRPRRESRRHNGISLRGLSQPTFATKFANNRRPMPSDRVCPSGEGRADARKNDAYFGELARPAIALYRSRMLLDDDVVTDRKAKARSFPGGLWSEERIEHLFLHVGGN